ncbi:hypothetical protein NEOLEDRAFT_1143461 [Neolentinus lepideus HHB14362 ss-1]|uniref:Uncharacterized protein n=1 Tax=Neolentinus lepideus HHB14362 ss-1 TaxID=1314782 RepID=A0A165MIW1_9AGAM|nr:hypothetical protein NEOLEDRAFT_1143461 [Neolentinus lepideus HHB14362 ss-1]
MTLSAMSRLFLFLVCIVVVPLSQAQSVAIGYPSAGSTISSSSNFTVEVDRPNSLTGSTEISVIISLRPCTTSSGSIVCASPTEEMGTVLYNGGYNPQYSDTGEEKPPHQNFSVAVPQGLEAGYALLSVGHVALVGAGNSPMFEVVYVDVQIASSD